MLTMRDVAERAGVSRATVSVVLNQRADTVGINEETRRRVLESAESLGYRRNELVRAVVSGHNRMLGFLVWRPEYEPVARMLAGALDEAEAHDYTIKVLRLRDKEVDCRTIERCVELRLSGVIIVKMPQQPLAYLHDEMKRRGIPVMTLGSSFAQPWGTRVTTDDALGCRLIIEHLQAVGHRRIAFIGGDREDAAAVLREKGFRAAMRELQLPVRRGYLTHGDWNIGTTIQATQRLLQLPDGGPTAIVCASDEMAMSACRTLRAAERRIPDDVSVTGFTNLSLANLCDPPLTTVWVPFEAMGQVAVRLTLQRVGAEYSDESLEEILSPQLVVRDSTAPPPSKKPATPLTR